MSVPEKGEAPDTTAKMDPPGKSTHRTSRKSHYESAFPPPLRSVTADETKKRICISAPDSTSSSPTSGWSRLVLPSYFSYAPYEERTCGICHQQQLDPVRTPCGHVFCKLCILTHHEKESKALVEHIESQTQAGVELLDSLSFLRLLGMHSEARFYSCPSCPKGFSTRPALQPYPGKQHHHVKGENDLFQSVSRLHKANLKKRIEQCTKGIGSHWSHTNRSVYIVKEDGQPIPCVINNYDYIGMRLPCWRQPTPQVINCNDLFRERQPSWEGQIKVRTVITQGASGFGKSNSLYKFIFHWADGKTNRDIDFVLMLPFWKLNLVRDFACSLHKLLLNFHPELNMLTDIKKLDDANIVVMFDGLDESQLPLDFQNNPIVCDITETSSVDTVITNVIKGNLLPFAQIWITSDPSTTSQIPWWFINRVTEITQFSDSEMEDCFRQSLSDVTQTTTIIQQMKLSKALPSLCYVPAFCSIAGSLVKNMPEQDEISVIQTRTELYSHFILGQIATAPESMSSYVQCEGENKIQTTSREVVLKFAKLAWKHLKNNNLTFFERDLKDCHIDVSDAESFFGLWAAVSEDNCELFQERVYRFTHVTIQEFLAALCVFNAWITKNKDILRDFFDNESEINHEDISLDSLLKRTVTHLLNEHYSRYHHFLRFLLGMSLESSQSLLQSLLTCRPTCTSSAAVANTLQYIKDMGKQKDVSLEKQIDLLHCQIEMRDASGIEDIQTLLKLQSSFSSFHWQEIALLVQMSEQILDKFQLQEDSSRSLVPHVLSAYVGCCRKARLQNSYVSHASFVAITSVLQQPDCPLRELDISGTNRVDDDGLNLLVSGLKSPNCKLEVLRLHGCHLSQASCSAIASVLQQPHSSLRELDLSGNDLGDVGVQLLCSGLKSPNCKLEVLRLQHRHLPHESCSAIASVLQQPHSSLRELDLSGTYLLDTGVQLLCSGLTSPNSKLEVLRLQHCLLSHESCSAIASVLQQPQCSLRELHLSGTKLWGWGVQRLCSGLKSPNCKLEVLRLHRCDLSQASCSAMASVLRQPHSSLRELDLSGNVLKDGGVQLLCVGLTSPNCKLEVLRLDGCGLTEKSSASLASVLESVHSCLRKVDVSNNAMEEKRVLTKRPKDPECKIDTLNKQLKGLSIQGSQGYPAESDESPGPSGVLPITQPIIEVAERRGLLRHPEENTGQAEDQSPSVEMGYVGDVEIFTPETSVSNRTAFRFGCSSSGWHQCLYTGLIFKTDSAADVEYQAVPWDGRMLEEKCLVAAGPLFKMKGLQGTVKQLGFPHCEIISGDNLPSLTIIHISGSKPEELQPQRISDTHVFLNISGFCGYGLAKKRRKDENDQPRIKALVMPFLDLDLRVLNILLLPRNVEHSVVWEKVTHMTAPRNVIYINTIPKCRLIPDEEYRLVCSSQTHKVQPKKADFDDGFDDYQYAPTFQVFLSNIEHIELSLHENGNEQVWCASINLPAYVNGGISVASPPSSPYTPPAQDFFRKHKKALETRLGLLSPMLSELEVHKVLIKEEIEEVESKNTKSQKNHALLSMIDDKGGLAQEELYKALCMKNMSLVKDLESPRSLHTGYLLNPVTRTVPPVARCNIH